MKTIEHFVVGKSFQVHQKELGKVFNPATGEQSARGYISFYKRCKSSY